MKPAIGALLGAGLCIYLGFAVKDRVLAQPAAPPTHYQVALRYRIIAPLDQHAILYNRLVKHLQGLQFEFQSPREDTDQIDPSKSEFRGRMPAANVARLRDNPQIAGIVLEPDGFKRADAPEKVRVRIELVGGLPLDRQRELAEQARGLLSTLGFTEATGYDHRGASGRPYTKLIGTLPKNQLDVLLKDLRNQPGGWFAPVIAPAELPLPLQAINPILMTEVLADTAPIADAGEPPARTPEYLEKIGPGLWEMVNDKAKETQLVRVQVLFAGNAPASQLRQTVLNAAQFAFVEGVLAGIVTVETSVSRVKALAAVPEVIGVRLPPPARGDVDSTLPANFAPAQVLQQAGLAELHARGKRGQQVRLAVVDADFRGWEEMVKAGKLPAATRLVDLTTERSADLIAAPIAAGAGLGHGTQCAVAAALAAPAADIVLIRVVGDDPQQLDEVNRFARGGPISATLERRLDELRVAGSMLNLKRKQLLEERRIILDNFRDEEDLRRDFEYLGPVYGWIFSDREWHRQNMAYQDKLEKDLQARDRRYWAFVGQVQSLQGLNMIVCSLTWNDGYPLGGASALARALDQEAGGPMWFVPAGNTAGQAWTGTFHDRDGNGLMEFAAPGAKLAAGRWTSELNFLAWQPHAGKQSPDLPAKAALHVTLQWREPHDPDYFVRAGEDDWYRKSLAGLTLTLLRQRDPEGKGAGVDALDVVARSRVVPDRLDHQPGGTVYEQVLDFVVDKPGRYALRIEQPQPSRWLLSQAKDQDQTRYVFELRPGVTTTGTRPVGAPNLPGLEKTWELRPRLFVDVTDAARFQGRPVLADYSTRAGGIGMPGDAQSVVTVGAAGLEGQPQPYSAAGAPPFIDLAAKPSVWAFDAVRHGPGAAWGTSLSASFAAGTAATLASTGMTREQIQESLRRQQGKLFRAE